MAFQIRRAHRFFSSSHNHVSLDSAVRTRSGKVAGTFSVALGVDIVAGAHFAKIDQLAGGFSDGQVVPAGTQPPTTSKFLTGGFVGVIGSWLGSQITKTIREGFR